MLVYAIGKLRANSYFTNMKQLFVFFTASFLLAPLSFGLELDPDAIRGKKKKSPVSVLQNRYFLKAYRPEVGLFAGSMLNEAYTDTGITGARLGLFFSEWLGVEIQGADTSVSPSDDAIALSKQKFRPINAEEDPTKRVTAVPEINPIRSFIEASLIYAPFYGKLTLIDGFIIYTDLYGTVGVSQLSTDLGELSSLNFGAGQRFYFGKSWSMRMEFKMRNFTEERNGQSQSADSTSIDFGLSYFFL